MMNLILAGTIARDPHHGESLTRCEQDLNLSSGLVEESCAVVITTTPWCHITTTSLQYMFLLLLKRLFPRRLFLTKHFGWEKLNKALLGKTRWPPFVFTGCSSIQFFNLVPFPNTVSARHFTLPLSMQHFTVTMTWHWSPGASRSTLT